MQPVMSDLTIRAARAFGDRQALITANRSLSFSGVEDLVASCASGLVALGVRPGQPVVIYLPNQWEWLVAYYAVARIGGVVVPANTLLSIEEVVFMIDDCNAVAVISTGLQCERLWSVTRAAARGESLKFICIDGDGSNEAFLEKKIAFEVLLLGPGCQPAEVNPDDLFTICYTSGTTGTPKGAMLTHRNVYMCTALTATMHVRQEGERVVSALPFPHVYGNVVLNSCFLIGMTLISTTRFDAAWALESIQRFEATLFEGVPTMYYYMLMHPSISATALKSLKRCTVGGQNMPVSKISEIVELFGCPLLELWGMTEVAGPALSHSPYLPANYGSAGQALPGLEARIVSTEDFNVALGVNSPGELLVRGSTVMKGYFHNPEATAESLLTGGWLRTGDVAVMESDGSVRIVDRIKDMIVTAGYKIYPVEVEQVIAALPEVSIVAVVAVADSLKGELAKAFIVLKDGAELSEAQVIEHCRAELAAYKVPRTIEFVKSLPLTGTGKILKRKLKAT